ncbi:hypothetical protein LUR56_19285 [Streptomyces sp. MT29]|nr:hypothetical protein [Streptomyces sp. MT29]
MNQVLPGRALVTAIVPDKDPAREPDHVVGPASVGRRRPRGADSASSPSLQPFLAKKSGYPVAAGRPLRAPSRRLRRTP